MIRRYTMLGGLVALAALALAVLGRPARPGPARPAAPPAIAAPASIEVTITISDDRVSPATAAVPVGSLVRLRVEHRGPGTARLTLAGHEDCLDIPALAPGATWDGEFLADRPGDDFAWMLDGRPAGRFAVTGSHLIEGHR